MWGGGVTLWRVFPLAPVGMISCLPFRVLLRARKTLSMSLYRQCNSLTLSGIFLACGPSANCSILLLPFPSTSISKQGRNVAILVHEFPDAGGGYSSGGGGGGGCTSKVTITLNGRATIQVREKPGMSRGVGVMFAVLELTGVGCSFQLAVFASKAR